MFVVLVNPNLHSSRSGGIGLPIGLLNISASLVRAGHDVQLLDANAYDLSVRSVVDRISVLNPSIVGLSVNTPSVGYVLKVAEEVKRSVPCARIVLGGIHASIFAEELVRLPYVDAIVKGEGDHAVLKALVKDGIHEESVDELDCLPSPAWNLVDLDKYSNFLVDGRFAMIMSSRGCPYNCIFCGADVMCGKRVRYRSVSSMANEFTVLHRLKVKWLIFQDDTFTLDKDRVYDLCGLLENNKFKWWCNTRVDHLDCELLDAMKAAGCEGFCVGVESGNQTILNKMKKSITLQQVRDGVALIKGCGLKSYGYFMIGNLDDTAVAIRETVDFAKSLPLDFAQFSVCTPFPATELYGVAKERGVISEPVDWSRFDWEAEPPNVSLMSVEERRAWLNRAIREFYLRPSQILKNFNVKGLKTGLRMLKK